MTARPARDIEVAQFTLLLQWPFVLVPPPGPGTMSNRIDRALAKTRQDLQAEGWVQADGLTVLGEKLSTPADREQAARDSYTEFAYFHDFLQVALYPETRAKDAAVEIWRHDGVTGIGFHLPGAVSPMEFVVARRTLHLFGFGCAIITLELACANTGAQSLADVQRGLDYIRRSYAPFFFGDSPARCPSLVRLTYAPKQGETVSTTITLPTPTRAAAMAEWKVARDNQGGAQRDIPVFEHWRRLIAPLRLLADGGWWRDPSDERIPINSYIRLAVPPGQSDPQTIAAIHDADWYRIADAEEPADPDKPLEASWPYNQHFCTHAPGKPVYYDRFLADKGCPGYATRHVFAGAHYSVVGAGGFFGSILHDHFRRHYAQMSLIARFEMTALLAISSRLTEAVRDLQVGADDLSHAARQDRQQAFEAAVLDIQDQFLGFVHRFRFTGVSSQMQGREMFELWRSTMGLDQMYHEVKDELEAAVSAVRARQGERESAAASTLNRIAFFGGIAALYFTALSVADKLALMPVLKGLWSPDPARQPGDPVTVLALLALFVATAWLGPKLGAGLLRWWRKNVLLR